MNEKVIEKLERSLPKMKEYLLTHELKNEKVVFKLDEKNLTCSKERKTFWG